MMAVSKDIQSSDGGVEGHATVAPARGTYGQTDASCSAAGIKPGPSEANSPAAPGSGLAVRLRKAAKDFEECREWHAGMEDSGDEPHWSIQGEMDEASKAALEAANFIETRAAPVDAGVREALDLLHTARLSSNNAKTSNVRLRRALTTVMAWIENWEPEFTQDDEWPADRDEAREALASSLGTDAIAQSDGSLCGESLLNQPSLNDGGGR